MCSKFEPYQADTSSSAHHKYLHAARQTCIDVQVPIRQRETQAGWWPHTGRPLSSRGIAPTLMSASSGCSATAAVISANKIGTTDISGTLAGTCRSQKKIMVAVDLRPDTR